MFPTYVWGPALALAGALLILDRVAVRMIKPPYKPLRKKASGLPFPCEALTLSSEGQELKAWVVRPENDNGGPVLTLVHGWGSDHGTMTRLGRPLLEAGYPVFFFDVRHHGKSRGAPYVTARNYRDDIATALKKVEELFPGRRSVLVGHSMGGSTGVMAVADGAPAQGLITIGAPADLWGIWAHYLNRRGLPGKWLVRLLKPFWLRRAGVPWDTLDPIKKAGEVKVPFLIIHSDADESVPLREAHLLAGGAGVTPQIVEGEEHTDILDSPVLLQRMVTFLKGLPA